MTRAGYQQQQAERRRRELMARYGQPVSLNPIPREYVEQLPGLDPGLPEHVREGIRRARLDSLLRRNEGGAT